MPKHLLAVLSIAGLLSGCTAQASTLAPEEAEFKRALSIIQQTQLEIFTDTPPQANQEILRRLQKRLAEITDHKNDTDTKKLELIREELSNTIDHYNDQYANYITPEALTRYREKRTGSYHGIGLKFRAKAEDYPIVIGPLIGGPLEHSNLQPGDQIISAATKDLKGSTSSEIVTLLKGPKNTSVELAIKREDATHTIQARRGPVELHYSSANIVDLDIGYLKISRFGGKTHKRVRKQLQQLLNQQVQGIVLDLRDNPGGSTRAARAIVSMFSTEEHVYCERYKSGAVKKLPRHGEHMTNLPLVVLVNGQSMSSSEIVAGALQSYGRAIIIGSPTYGKGLVQKVFNLQAPLGGAIRTTIAAFGTPIGQPIHAAGVVPDKYIETDAGFMFRRTGSLNVHENARRFQRLLLEQRVKIDFPDKAQHYIDASDEPLSMAINELKSVTSRRAPNRTIAQQTELNRSDRQRQQH